MCLVISNKYTSNGSITSYMMIYSHDGSASLALNYPEVIFIDVRTNHLKDSHSRL